jgi:hypothetical protein
MSSDTESTKQSRIKVRPALDPEGWSALSGIQHLKYFVESYSAMVEGSFYMLNKRMGRVGHYKD